MKWGGRRVLTPRGFSVAVATLLTAGVSIPAEAVAPPSPILTHPEIYQPRELTPEIARIKATGEVLRDNFEMARVYQTIAQDPVVSGLLAWRETLFVDHDGAFEEITRFLNEHPGWPAADAMRTRAEKALWQWTRTPETVTEFFKTRAPKTISGKLALARAQRALGKTEVAAKLIREMWQSETLSASLEETILKAEEGTLTETDHKARFARRIYAGDLSGALRAGKRISKDHEKIAKAALSLSKGHKEGLKLYNKLPASAKSQAAMRYAMARYQRLTDKEDEARKTALAVKPSDSGSFDAEAWWEEKRQLIRHALKQNGGTAWREAYQLASTHGNDSGLPFVEGEFLSGWIALRFLKEPEKALPHFVTLSKGNDRPVNISQGEYWAGRSYDAMGQPAEASKHYALAGGHPETFYGQLARDRLGWPRVADTVALGSSATVDSLAQLDKDEVFQAARLVASAGREDLLPMFFGALMKKAQTREQKSAIAGLVSRMGWPHVAVRLAKAEAQDGIDLGAETFPTPVYAHDHLTAAPEPALVYGVIRQESEFNPKAESHAGARGLMQIMPNTAKGLSRNYKADYDLPRLVTDPDYNVQLGSALLHELLRTFDGSYAMVLAAYNAGPSPVNRWIEEYGDPRKGEIDLLDWIELIPFSETRNYVKRVMENVNVYRARFREERPDTLFVGLQRSLKGDLQRQASCQVSQSVVKAGVITCE
ncbi:soluble lytic murein transglycosylase [Rhodoligotrophos appendicifer]|uniref:lytic transglycosylase domain-containing protein n=1 Tax=Rhodoligotrophos appendicifer TaxID=987056 RepID=UPI001184E4C4|nr:lytic transglycosylase domain-containing protein [Rhodoligotrophos appendicifer]